MKSLIITTILILIPFILPAQEAELNGALSLTFGMSKTQVKTIMTSKQGVYDPEMSSESILAFKNVVVGSKKPEIVALKFVNNKLFEIVIMFIPDLEAKTQELYDDIVSLIENKYADGYSTRNFTGIYEDGDGYEMQAVSNGYADIYTLWTFKNESAIKVEITENLVVLLSYQDGRLVQEAIELRRQKDNEEF